MFIEILLTVLRAFYVLGEFRFKSTVYSYLFWRFKGAMPQMAQLERKKNGIIFS